MKVYKVNPQHPEAEVIQAAAGAIKKGGVVAFPTAGLYGLGADACNAVAVDRLFDIKQRRRGNPILILVDSRAQLQEFAARIPDAALQIMDHFWPGGVTIVFEAAAGVGQSLTGGTGKIGIRQAGHPVAVALIGALRGPITGTSANFSGAPGCQRVADLDLELVRRLDLIIDAGPLKGARGSTVVDITGPRPRILREGAISGQKIMALIG